MFAIQRFEQLTDQDPDRIAIVDGERAISYKSLDENSNRLAHYLINLGIGPGSLVCTHLPPQFDLIVAILAIAKTGVAFLTIDPQLPKVRKRLMVDDCEPDALITSEGVEWVANDKVPIVDLTHDFSKIEAETETRPASRFVEGSLSYLFYTSGSTGEPKAVMVPWRAQPPPNETAPHSGEHDRHVLKSSPAFTLIVREIFQPITSGGRVYLLPDGQSRDPDSLLDIILAKNITLITVVPSVLRAMLASPKLPLCHSLRFIDCIGEALPPELRIAFQKKLPVPLGVTYGCTEASSATLRVYNPGDHCDQIDLGKPLPNRSVYVLDEDLSRVAKGKIGQIFVGGKLAIGYFKQPRLTAERFIPDLYSPIPGTRMYGTGDQGRFSSDGSLIYEGRGDDQVQINGQRVEPAEVEKVIATHDSVDQAVVMKCGASMQSYLVAFVVLCVEGLTEKLLREYTRSHLPHYMVPARFMFLNALPLLPSGKLDRGRLLASATFPLVVNGEVTRNAVLSAFGTHVASNGENRQDLKRFPETRKRGDDYAIESERNLLQTVERMTEVWQEVLRIHGLGADDNFFDLGGNSLLAVELILKVEEVFSVRLPFNTLLKAPTARQFAAKLRSKRSDATYFTLAPVNPNCFKLPIFLIHGLFLYRELAYCLGADQPAYGIYVEKEVHAQSDNESLVELPFPTVEELAGRYKEEIRTVQPKGPYQLGGESFGGLVAFEIAQQLIKEGEEVKLLALFDANGPGTFDTTYTVRLRNHFKDILIKGTPYIGKMLKRKISGIARACSQRIESRRDGLPKRHLRALVSCEYKVCPFPGNIVLFRAMENDWSGHHRPEDLGWSAYAKEGLIIHKIPGDHLGILKTPNVEILAQKLGVYLQRSER